MEEAQKPRWYVVTCYSRQEEKVRNDLIKRAESADVTQLILDVRIVKKREIHDKTGKEQERNLYPGYLFAYMTMNDEAWYIVRNTPGVTGISGSSGKGTKPIPLTEKEVNEMLEKISLHENHKNVDYNYSFEIGENVTILFGPFKHQQGKISRIEEKKAVATVDIEFLGRRTPMEIEFIYLEKIK